MKKTTLIHFLGIFMLLPLCAGAETPPAFRVTTHTLSNGMEVWLNEDHTSPTVMGIVAVKAGAKECPDTGIAHYFEHMMFKGTDRIGTVDYEKEKPFLDSIGYEYSRLKDAESDDERRSIHQRINELSGEAAKYAVPNEFSSLITEFGGSDLNAGTSWDYTIYYNTFASQNMVPWLELNSERLINPVFRMFQSELETVYEEKNMYSDGVGAGALEYALERLFEPHPYSRPIIGTTEHLKNPDLGAMREFYEKYYVAGNMALILSGDFDTEATLVQIEKYFSRVPAGEVVREPLPDPRPFSGRETVKLKIPIPFLKFGVNMWRTPEDNHPDNVILEVAVGLLNNDNGTGLLDEMTKEHQVLIAGMGGVALNDTGLMALLYIPKGIVSGLRKAEELSLAAVEKIKCGDFTDEEFESTKKEWIKYFDLDMESSKYRAMLMCSLYTSGKNWDDYMAIRDRIASLTREDITEVMERYLGPDRMVFEKKTGNYPKDQLDKPEFGAVEPQREVTESEYARELAASFRQGLSPRFIDLRADMNIEEAGNNRIICVDNPYNDIFRLELRYSIGRNARPLVGIIPSYLEYCDTDSLTNVEFQRKLRELGATAWFNAGDETFSIWLEGFEQNLDMEEAHALLAGFIEGLKPSKKGKKSMVSAQAMYERSRSRSSDDVAEAASEKLLYGANARQLREISAKELRKTKGEDILALLGEIRAYRTGAFYTGDRSPEDIATLTGIAAEQKPVAGEYYRPLRDFTKDETYIVDMHDSRQCIIDMYVRTGEMAQMRDRHLARLFNMYMGGSMNSLLFQELREYRSFAYSAWSYIQVPRLDETERTALFNCYMTTQADKTEEAIGVLDSLVRNVEFTQERLDRAVRQLCNDINNNYPGFRSLASRTDAFLLEGYDDDPNKALYETLQDVTLADLQDFYDRHIRARASLTVITGNTKALGKETLGRLDAVELKKKDLFRE